MVQKKRYQASLYHEVIPETEASIMARETWEFEEYGILKEFRGRHPAVMAERLSASAHLRQRKNRWPNWRFYREVLAHGFKG